MLYFESLSEPFSFGIVMFEIFSGGMQPYNWMSNQEVVESVTKQGCTLKIPDKCPDVIWELMKECWSMDPVERPHFKKVNYI